MSQPIVSVSKPSPEALHQIMQLVFIGMLGNFKVVSPNLTFLLIRKHRHLIDANPDFVSQYFKIISVNYYKLHVYYKQDIFIRNAN